MSFSIRVTASPNAPSFRIFEREKKTLCGCRAGYAGILVTRDDHGEAVETDVQFEATTISGEWTAPGSNVLDCVVEARIPGVQGPQRASLFIDAATGRGLLAPVPV